MFIKLVCKIQRHIKKCYLHILLDFSEVTNNLKFKGALKIYLLWCVVVNGFNGVIVVNIQHSIPFLNYLVCTIHPYLCMPLLRERIFHWNHRIIMVHINYHPLLHILTKGHTNLTYKTGKNGVIVVKTYWPFKCHIKKRFICYQGGCLPKISCLSWIQVITGNYHKSFQMKLQLFLIWS